jgi:hypothetical protein
MRRHDLPWKALAIAWVMGGCGAAVRDTAPADATPAAPVLPSGPDARVPPDERTVADERPVPDARAPDTTPATAARDATPTPDTAPIHADPAAVTSIASTTGSGVYVLVTAASAGAGMVEGTHGDTKVWKYDQAGAYLEYTVSTATAGAYGLAIVYWAMQAGGSAAVLIDGAMAGTVTFGSTVGASRQGGGGIPSCCGRATTVLARLRAGTSKVRIAFTPGTTPVDLVGIQVDSAKAPLPDFGKVHQLSASAATPLQPDAVSDFFRLQYTDGAWQCVWSFCFIEYQVSTERAGAYEVALRYAAAMGAGRPGCAEFLVDYKLQGAVKLDSTTTISAAPVTVMLPAGVSRLRIRNGDYFQGTFCWGARFVDAVVKPVP